MSEEKKIAYNIQELQLDIPTNWKDESLNILTFPEQDGGNLVINRSLVPNGTEPEAFLKEQADLLAEELEDFEKHHQEVTLFKGNPAMILDYEWSSPEGEMHQFNKMLVLGEQLLSFTFTQMRPLTEANRKQYRQVLNSIQLRASIDPTIWH